MAESVKKIILVGWDVAPPHMIERMINKGLLENFAGLMKRGCGPNYQDEFHKITPDIVFSTETYPGIRASEPVIISQAEGHWNQ